MGSAWPRPLDRAQVTQHKIEDLRVALEDFPTKAQLMLRFRDSRGHSQVLYTRMHRTLTFYKVLNRLLFDINVQLPEPQDNKANTPDRFKVYRRSGMRYRRVDLARHVGAILPLDRVLYEVVVVPRGSCPLRL